MDNWTSPGNKNQKWPYMLIGLLAFLLTAQTAGVLFYLFSARHEEKIARREAYRSYVPAASAPAHYGRTSRAVQRPAAAAAWQDPFEQDPFSAMSRIEDHMNRIFNNFFAYATPFAGQAAPLGDYSDFMPQTDFSEKDGAYVVQMDLPGLDKDKIDIAVRGNLLTIHGTRSSGSETKDERSGFYTQERSYGTFARTVPLPGPVDEANVKADYKEGVLTITLPKTGGDKTAQKIQIQ